MRRLLRSLRLGCHSGTTAMEFALMLPILMMLVVGMVEFARFFIIQQKLDILAHSMTDYASQDDQLTILELQSYTNVIPQIMTPFTFSGTVIFSAIYDFSSAPVAPCTSTGTACILWQYSIVGNDASRIGSPGGTATLPASYVLPANQEAVAVEAFYLYQPLFPIPFVTAGVGTFGPFIPAQKLYRVTVAKLRGASSFSLN